MGLEDIFYAPARGGKDNSGRQALLGFSVWRRRDNRFLDAVSGVWMSGVVVNPLQEQGRAADTCKFGGAHQHLRGLYLPEKEINLGEEPLEGEYVVFFHNREADKMILGQATYRYPAAPAPRPSPPVYLHEPTLLGLCAVLVLAGLTTVLRARRHTEDITE